MTGSGHGWGGGGGRVKEIGGPMKYSISYILLESMQSDGY